MWIVLLKTVQPVLKPYSICLATKQNSFCKAGFIVPCCYGSEFADHWKMRLSTLDLTLLCLNAESVVYFSLGRTLPHHLLMPVKKRPSLVMVMVRVKLAVTMKELQQPRSGNLVSGGTGRPGMIIVFRLILIVVFVHNC